MKYTKLVVGPLIAVFCVATIGYLSVGASDSKTRQAEDSVPGPLDGMTFTGMLGPDGKPKDVADVFVFENGNFASKECQLRCEYPARPYFVRVDGERFEFISETKCPYKDAWITWRGTVEGDTIRGTSTWVVKRWYWTVEDTYAFEGRLAPQASTENSD